MLSRKPRFAFVGWNPFQLLQARDVARVLEGSVMVIERRATHAEQFSGELLSSCKAPVVIWERERMHELDQMFDVVVCQTIFTHIERFERAKIAMLQYGLAKEPHNHGAWRSLADLCLVYGPYTAGKISHFCPVAAVGNPRFDSWGTPEHARRARERFGHLVDPEVKTVLYAPTWGELSTQEHYMEEIWRLGERYNVLLKLHHNTDLLEAHRKAALPKRVRYLGANDDLLELLVLADVLLSDYSGAIFDAIYCEKPVILLQQDTSERFGAKLDTNSLEYAAQARIGPVVSNPAELPAVVERVFARQLDYTRENAELSRELFVRGPGAAERAAEALRALARGEIGTLSPVQQYVRDEVRRGRKLAEGPKAKKPKKVAR